MITLSLSSVISPENHGDWEDYWRGYWRGHLLKRKLLPFYLFASSREAPWGQPRTILIAKCPSSLIFFVQTLRIIIARLLYFATRARMMRQLEYNRRGVVIGKEAAWCARAASVKILVAVDTLDRTESLWSNESCYVGSVAKIRSRLFAWIRSELSIRRRVNWRARTSHTFDPTILPDDITILA